MYILIRKRLKIIVIANNLGSQGERERETVLNEALLQPQEGPTP